jgi:hypothetical protein
VTGGLVRCALGTLSGSNIATVRVRAVAERAGWLTNEVVVTRLGIDNYLANNRVVLISEAVNPSFHIAHASVLEGDQGTTNLLFPVYLPASIGRTATVAYATCSMTAGAATDYVRTNGLLRFLPGVLTQFVSVTVAGDLTHEADDTLCVTLFSPTNATLGVAEATGTIINDDPLPRIAIDDVTAPEGNVGSQQFDFRISLDRPSSFTIQVPFATTHGSAGDSDYRPVAGTLLFYPGMLEQTLSVDVYGDRLPENHESFVVELRPPLNAVLAGRFGQGTILDDDGPTDPRPVLQMRRTGNQVELSWPAPSAFVLEQADDLWMQEPWHMVMPLPAEIDGRYKLIISLERSRMFYRLRSLGGS